MGRRLIIACSVILILSWTTGPKTLAPGRSVASGVSGLIAEPFEGHSGDVIYLSGYGLRPNFRYKQLLMYCPSWAQAAAYNQAAFVPGPKTNRAGQFKLFKLRAIHIFHVNRSSCQIYADDRTNHFGPDIPALYFIEAPDRPLLPCAQRICLNVQAFPKRARSGFREKVEVRGWPGAKGSVTLAYAGLKTRHAKLSLDARGFARASFGVPSGVSGTQARVGVQLRLGKSRGNGKTSFTVVS